MTAFYGKLTELAKRKRTARQELKELLLEQASAKFGRSIASPAELLKHEASLVLDEMDDEIVMAMAA